MALSVIAPEGLSYTPVNKAGDTLTGRTLVKDNVNSDGSYPFGIQNGSNQQWWFRALPNGNSALALNGLGDVLSMDTVGRVLTPQQPFIFGTPGGDVSGYATRFYQGISRGITFSNSRVTVPVSGVYSVSFNTITASTVGRVDTRVDVNGVEILNGLSEENGSGYHMRSVHANLYLSANDYVQFSSGSWYSTGTGFTPWQTASIALIG